MSTTIGDGSTVPPTAPATVIVPERVPARVLVTGGAGFIGTHLVDVLTAAGREVTVLDNVSSGDAGWLRDAAARGVRTIIADLTDTGAVADAVRGQGMVWHLAGNADIPGGINDTWLDLEAAVIGTRNVCDAMVDHGVRDLVFTSSGSVYGNLARRPVGEQAGPLLPLSFYAAGKIAAEAFISGFCSLFDLNAWIFRLGNVLGARMCRGAIRDFAHRLADDPERLRILGDGRQSKNYFLVEDCIDGMMTVFDRARPTPDQPCVLVNLGGADATGITRVAHEVAGAMGLSDVRHSFTGGSVGWPGDQPVVNLDVGMVRALGWQPRHSSDTAVRVAAHRMVAHLGLAPSESAKTETAR